MRMFQFDESVGDITAALTVRGVAFDTIVIRGIVYLVKFCKASTIGS